MPIDYDNVVRDCAEELGATIVDIRDALVDPETAPQIREQILTGIMSGYGPVESAFSDLFETALYISTPVETDTECLIALHELGHLATTPPMSQFQYELDAPCWEAAATEWALSHFPGKPSPEAAGFMQLALDGYKAAGGNGGESLSRVEKRLHALQA